jgi:hypothetical protein
MKTVTRLSLSIVLVTFLSIDLTAQSFDSVYVKKNMFKSPCFYHGNKKIPMRQIVVRSRGNQKAQFAIKKLRQEKVLAIATAVPTGLALGLGLGNIINNSSNDLKYVLLGSGVIGYINLIYLENSVKPMYMQQIADALNKPN